MRRLSPNSARICAGGLDAVLRVWGRGEGELQRSPVCAEPEFHDIRAVAFSPDGNRIAWAGADRAVRIWDVKQAREIGSFEGHRGEVSSLTYSVSGRLLASGSADGTVLIWDATRADDQRHE